MFLDVYDMVLLQFSLTALLYHLIPFFFVPDLIVAGDTFFLLSFSDISEIFVMPQQRGVKRANC